MRLFCLMLCALTLLWSAPAESRPNLKNLGKPIELDSGTAKRMYVIFNHSSHKSVACRTCHHMGLPGNRYAACTNPECHSLPGPAERKPMSVYMAYHAPDTNRSCYGCHKPLAGKYPGFHGCSPCHLTPTGRAAQAAKK